MRKAPPDLSGRALLLGLGKISVHTRRRAPQNPFRGRFQYAPCIARKQGAGTPSAARSPASMRAMSAGKASPAGTRRGVRQPVEAIMGDERHGRALGPHVDREAAIDPGREEHVVRPWCRRRRGAEWHDKTETGSSAMAMVEMVRRHDHDPAHLGHLRRNASHVEIAHEKRPPPRGKGDRHGWLVDDAEGRFASGHQADLPSRSQRRTPASPPSAGMNCRPATV